MFHAAILRAPSGGGPIARDTEHCGQKHIRWAADFWRGRIPTVCANIYTATDLCPASSSRLQRRQHKFSKGPPGEQLRPRGNTVANHQSSQVCRRIPASGSNLSARSTLSTTPEPRCALARRRQDHALCCYAR
jgi:hypothetical protein